MDKIITVLGYKNFITEMSDAPDCLWILSYRAFWDAEKWMTLIGLNQAPVEPSSADTCGIHRSHVRLDGS